MEYYSAIRKDEILSLATIWMELEIIMLSEISQKKLRTIRFHSYVGYRTKQQMNNTNRNSWTRTIVSGYQRKRGEVRRYTRVKGVKYMVMEGNK